VITTGKNTEKLGLDRRRIILRLSILLLLTALFCLVAGLVISGALYRVEASVYAALTQIMTPWLTSAMLIITSGGSTLVIVVVAAALLLIPPTRLSYGISVALASIGGILAMFALIELIARERPSELWLQAASGYSFPSGHTTACTVVMVTIFLVFIRQQRSAKARALVLAVCVVVALLVGISRIYLGVHYTGDVLGGLILGTFVALLVDTILRVSGAARISK
jgi:undecaprenyl-diphosphatase